MILIAGATGNIGRPLVRMLHEQGEHVRAVSRDRDKAKATLPQGVEIVTGSLTDEGFRKDVLRGAERIFLFLEAGDPCTILRDANEIGKAVLVTSGLAETLPNGFVGQLSADAEGALRSTAADWTILRPWEFASNTLEWAREVRTTGTVRKPSVGFPSPVIDPQDVALAAARALTEDHAGKTYLLTGPREITPPEKLAAISKAIGRRLAFEEVGTPEDLVKIQEAPDQVSEGFGVCFMRSPGVRSDLFEITGRQPNTYEDWVARNVKNFL